MIFKYLLAFILLIDTSYSLTEELVLVDILSNTISQLNELEKLVSNAEKYTKKVQEYNEIALDIGMRIDLIEAITMDLVRTDPYKVKNLENLNDLIRKVKGRYSDLSYQIGYFALNDQKIKSQKLKKRPSSKKDYQTLKKLANRATSKSTVKGKISTIAQASVDIDRNLISIKKQNDETQKILLDQNEILNQQILEKKIRDQNRLKFYGVEK